MDKFVHRFMACVHNNKNTTSPHALSGFNIGRCKSCHTPPPFEWTKSCHRPTPAEYHGATLNLGVSGWGCDDGCVNHVVVAATTAD